MPNYSCKIVFLTMTCAALSACGGAGGGGSDGGDPDGPDVTPNPELVYADDAPVTRESYYNKTFPIFIITQDPDTGALGRTTGSVEYVGDNKVLLTYNGVTTEYDLRDPDGQRINYTTDLASNMTDLVLSTKTSETTSRPSDVFGEAAIRHTEIDPNPFGVLGVDHGVFGLVTPENRLMGTARYTTDFRNEVLITTTSWVDETGDDTAYTRVDEVKAVSVDGFDLSVDFDSGTVSGTLLEGSFQTIDDRQGGANQVSHEIAITLDDGMITGSGFTGDMALTTTPSSNPREPGAGVQPTMPSVVEITNQSLDGQFFGYNHEGVGGAFEIDYEETFFRGENFFEDVEAEELTESRTIVGIFASEKD